MPRKRMGFEGILLWGAAGGTASTALSLVRDASYNVSPVYGDTSDRSTLCNLSDVAGFDFELQFEVSNHDGNAFIAAARAAAVTGEALAFRTRDRAAGWGVDADFCIRLEENQALRDAQRIRIIATPTDKNGRIPTWS
jgi:phage head maturation protease